MNVRKILFLASFSVLLATSCTSQTPEPSGELPPVDDLVDAREPDEGPPPGLMCCESGVCPVGETCIAGACHALPGASGCYNKGACEAGQECIGAVTCPCEDDACEPESGVCRYPDGCCNASDECGENERCISGICHSNPVEGRCFFDKDCAPGLVCELEQTCSCGQDNCTTAAGICTQPGPCCLSDAECGDQALCLGGACEAQPSKGACFASGDCADGLVCAGASICPCSQSGCTIPTTPGLCSETDSTCCVSDADCGTGEVCVDGQQCVPAPLENTCYKDGHCGKGRVCQGATLCGCGESDCENVAGACHTLVTECAGEQDCGPGMRCIAPDATFCPFDGTTEDPGKQASGPAMVCVPDVESGCWTTDDCSSDERCLVDTVCVDPDGCAGPNIPGKCEPKAGKDTCCTSHKDCAEGLECRNSNTFQTCPPAPTAVCLPKPDFGINCWNFEDCPASQVCIKSRICACGARCFKSGRGWCEPASQQGCNSDLDCGDSYSCARDLECVLNPCNATDNCPLGGLCHPDVPGSCWNHKDCGDGNYCKGLRICPVDAVCEEMDKPGECAPKEQVGACCDSYLACQPGLRCVSGINKSQCSLDVTSICVPYGVFNQSCYTDDECAENRFCSGQTLCGCGIDGCEALPSPGTCVLK